MSKVYFASAKPKAMKPDASLPPKFARMLDGLPLKDMFAHKSVAIKMHLGGEVGFTTIPPLFVKMLIEKIKKAGGRPFVTDGTGAIPTAVDRGYTEEVLGAPVVPAAGVNEKYFQTLPIGYRSLKEVYGCGEIVDADAMVVLSHGKGHGQCGWGGAIKNIAMGCVIGKSRGGIHGLMDTEFDWKSEECTHCEQCVTNCPTGASSFNKEGKFHIFTHHCRYCMHCVDSCPAGAISISTAGVEYFQTGMAKVTKAILDTFDFDRVLYINHVMQVTPFCDCWGFSSPAIVPDVGIFAGTDIVSVEQASIDSIKLENYIQGSLTEPLQINDVEGHLLQKIHFKDPYLQCRQSAAEGLGELEYEVVEVE